MATNQETMREKKMQEARWSVGRSLVAGSLWQRNWNKVLRLERAAIAVGVERERGRQRKRKTQGGT